MTYYKIIKSIFYLLSLSINLYFYATVNTYAKSNTYSKLSTLEKKLNQAFQKSKLSTKNIGAIASYTQNNNFQLYHLNSEKLFTPASLMKLITASALLDNLSPNLKFQTYFLARDPIHRSVLNGNLYLYGGGDPGFVSESLWNLVNHLYRTGLKKIEGDLVVDDSRFDKQRRGHRLSTPSHSSYDAPVGALSFNWNTVNIYLRPSHKIQKPLILNIDPSPIYFTSIKNQTKSVLKKNINRIFIYRKESKNRESLKITGALSHNSKEILIYKNILHPEIWTGWQAIDFLKQRDITVTGQVKIGTVPKTARVLAKWEGPPLSELIKSMMKYSNNFITEMLVKNMTAELVSKPGNLDEGLKLIRSHIKEKLNIDPNKYQLIQASGLHQKNKVTARQLLKVLQYWNTHPLQAEFESALPIAGEDGTLKKHFKNSALRGAIHAKTGSINGVAGLAGYLVTKKKNKISFVFLFNGSNSMRKQAEKLFHRWCYILWNFA